MHIYIDFFLNQISIQAHISFDLPFFFSHLEAEDKSPGSVLRILGKIFRFQYLIL